MKQIWPNYSYSPTTNVLTLTGLNIDRDQLLLVTAADRGRIMYNFADSSVTASAFTSGANTALTLVATTAGLTTTAALVIYYDDQVAGISGTVTANVVGTNTTAQIPLNMAYNDETFTNGNRLAVSIVNSQGEEYATPLPISGTVTAGGLWYDGSNYQPTPFKVAEEGELFVFSYLQNAIPAGTNRIGVVTIGAGTVTLGASTSQIGSVTAFLAYSQTTVSLSSVTATAIPIVLPTNGIYGGTLQGYNGTNTYIYSGIQAIGGTSLASATSLPVSLGSLPALVAGTAQIGSVTASISGTVPISISSVTVGNSVTIGSLPALVAGTAQIGSVTASISNTAVTVYPAQGTTVTNSNFTSLTSSTSLVSAVAGRKVLSVFNEGAGNLHISPNATCTTISYQVRLSSGDYWECPQGQLSLAHTAVFATAGTARITEVS